MPGPVPGFGGPSPRPSLGFFKPELCEFVGVVVVVTVGACCMSRGGEFVGAVVVVTVVGAVVVACCMSRGGEFVGAVVVTVVVWWMRPGGAFVAAVVVTVVAWGMRSGRAFGTFYARHQERAAVLAGA